MVGVDSTAIERSTDVSARLTVKATLAQGMATTAAAKMANAITWFTGTM